MARTAPVPNIPPIPGMCPSIAVMGGGGSGGGGSGKGGKNRNGKGGGGNGDGADGADGDGRNAGCGPGAGADGGGCPNHHGNAGASGGSAAGDPVDFASGGVFTPPMTDVVMGGPLPLRFWRSYTTAAREVDVGFGRGVCHAFAWSIEEGRSTMKVRTPEGGTYTLPRVTQEAAILGPYGWLFHLEPGGLVMDMPSLDRYAFERIGKTDTHRLVSIQNRLGWRITFRYGAKNLLEEIVDAAGRTLRFANDGKGHVTALHVTHPTQPNAWATVASYGYDAAGRLTGSRDAEGFQTSYTYDEEDRLTSYTRPGGTRFRYVYDLEGRCVETWGELANGAPDPSLDPEAPEVLADGSTRARGIHHVRLSFGPDDDREAVDSTALHRGVANDLGKFDKLALGGAVYTRTFDARGYLESFTDALGATTRYVRDMRGRELRVEDAEGAVTTIERDQNGDIVRVVDPAGGVTEVMQTPNGIAFRDPMDALFQLELDERGLMKTTIAPDGSRVRYVHDAQGNQIEKHDPRGNVDRFRYDGWGRCVEHVDRAGGKRAYWWSERGHLLAYQRPDGLTFRYGYDADGEVSTVSDDRGTVTFTYGANARLFEVLQPTGDRTRFFYDREGRMTKIVNNAGEEHRIVRRADGLPLEERTYDGRTIHYRHDVMGRLLSREEGSEKVSFERDLLGRIKTREHADGAAETFVYDLRGDVVKATSPGVTVRFDRNPVGWITRETQIVDDEAIEVRTDWDGMAQLSSMSTSLGHTLAFRRHATGAHVDVDLDGDESVRIDVDPLDREIVRRLGGGARIDTAYDPLGRVVGRRVFGAGAPRTDGQPDWLGDSPPHATVDQRFQFIGEALASRWDKTDGSTEYAHDPMGRLLRAVPAKLRPSVFRYDAGGRPNEAGDGAPQREHAPGGVLTRRGEVEYQHDDQARLVARVERDAKGAAQTTRHAYLGGRLASSELPDGRVVTYAYDAFGRRMKKTLSARKQGKLAHVSTTRFVWQATTMVQEVKTFVDDAGAAAVDERTFCFDRRGVMPWAQRTRRRRGKEEVSGPWLHLLCDVTGTPEKLVARDGKVAAAWTRAPFGEVTTEAGTPLRMLGHYADAETGLHYNWHRYYDPATGRYTTPDPIGLDGGPDPFAYAYNAPVTMVDPDGLIFTVIRNADGEPIASGVNQAGLPRGTSPGPMDPMLAGAGARPSCAETAALNQMAGGMTGTPEQRRAQMQNAFTPTDQGGQGCTMHTYDFKNEEEYNKASKKEREARRVNPCAQCGQMIQALGIQQGVVGVNPANHRAAPWRPNWIYPRR